MNEKITEVITTLATKAAATHDAGDAQRFAQAALNVAHVLATINNLKQTVK